MRLLYCYVEFMNSKGVPEPLRGLEKIELNLSTREFFSFVKNSTDSLNQLVGSRRNRPLPDKFWSNTEDAESNIYNVNVIVGENGAGKSTVINYLTDLLYCIYLGPDAYEQTKGYHSRFDIRKNYNLLLFEQDNTEERNLYLVSLGPSNMQQSCPEFNEYLRKNQVTYYNLTSEINEKKAEFLNQFRKIKLVYMNNTLTRRDYSLCLEANMRARFYFAYNTSLGSTIGNSVQWHFDYQVFRQVKYVFDPKQYDIWSRINPETIGLHVPRELTFHLRRESFNVDTKCFPLVNKKYPQLDSASFWMEYPSQALPIWLCILSVYAFRANLQNLSSDISLPDLVSNLIIPDNDDALQACYDEFEEQILLLENYVKEKLDHGRSNYVAVLSERCRKYINEILDLCRESTERKSDTSLFDKFYNNRLGELSFSLPVSAIVKKADAVKKLVNFIRLYIDTSGAAYTIDFSWGLSSGEESMLRILSSLFHLLEQNKIYNAELTNESKQRIKCDSLILLMDEADLTLHPEWQRKLISIFTTFLPLIFPRECVKDIHLILSTHSPLLLGDIPPGNAIYLPSGCRNKEPINTFGQNIHLILKQSFFLSNGTIGEFAVQKINNLAKQIILLESSSASVEERRKELSICKESVRLIAPGVLRSKLEYMLAEAEKTIDESTEEAIKPYIQQLIAVVENLPDCDRECLLNELQRRSEL